MCVCTNYYVRVLVCERETLGKNKKLYIIYKTSERKEEKNEREKNEIKPTEEGSVCVCT